MRNFVALCGASILVIAAMAVIPEAAAQDPAPDYFGTADTNYHYVSAEEFVPFLPESVDWIDAGTGGARYMDGSPGMVSANVRLPTGVLITGMAVVYEDSDIVNDLEVYFYRTWWGVGSRGVDFIGPGFFSSGTPGITWTYVDLDPDQTVMYIAPPISVQSYRLVAWLDASSGVQLRGVIIYWNRQISPAPVTATFADVPVGSFGFKHVEALAASGITAGCGGGNFCPNNTLTRVEMAVFLAKALGLHWSP